MHSSVLTSPPLTYISSFLPSEEADDLLTMLSHQLDWQRPSLRLYGKEHPIPRQQVWMGDCHYRYSGQIFTPEPWHPHVEQIRQRLEQQLAPYRFNSVLLNRYRDGNERMGWHSDNEPELGNAPCIASISLGSCRPLRWRWKDRSEPSFNIWLEHGSLLVMGPGVQERLEHALLPRKIAGQRINLTFRWIER
uniref:alpha-ketoglutarate-dependent dioxygenase AlkB family protein n=1 Tax=Halomonas sp. TaxID=1486246 RepID=UPI0026314BE1|nr:alpha-ketoglutarate-dependent dioxygenase AlkB [Halomonas sp.]